MLVCKPVPNYATEDDFHLKLRHPWGKCSEWAASRVSRSNSFVVKFACYRSQIILHGLNLRGILCIIFVVKIMTN